MAVLSKISPVGAVLPPRFCLPFVNDSDGDSHSHSESDIESDGDGCRMLSCSLL